MARLHPISGSCEDPQRKADVVFIHGLGEDAFKTWRHGDGDETSWPHWVAEAFPEVGVWSLGYAAEPSNSLGALANLFRPGKRASADGVSLPDRAAQLLDLMRLDERFPGERPIVFVCHSIGGLLLKDLLRLDYCGDSAANTGAISRRTVAVLFLSTPHHGAGFLKFVGSVSAFMGGAIKSESDQYLLELYDWYRDCSTKLEIATVTYFEGRSLSGFRVVDELSAQAGVGSRAVMLDEDHLSIAKPRAQNAQVCLALNDLLRKALMASVNARGESASSDGIGSRMVGTSLTGAQLLGTAVRLEGLGSTAENSVVESDFSDAAPSPSSTANDGAAESERLTQGLDESDADSVSENATGDPGQQVFISYAADDPDWTEERVRRFAAQLDELPIFVRLDVRFEESGERNIAPAEWRRWMDESLEISSNIICLCSERYALSWKRDKLLSGGCGVAYESARIERYLYDEKQNNSGRVLVVTSARRMDVIPGALRDACPHYVWGDEKHDRRLRSHLSPRRAPVGLSEKAVGEPISPVDARWVDDSEVDVVRNPGRAVKASGIPLDGNMLQHQADHAIKSLLRAKSYWAALQESENLKNWLTVNCLVSPLAFVSALGALSPQLKTDAMLELREVFKETRPGLVEQETSEAAAATVACFLYCACSLIKAEFGSALVGLPMAGQRDAAHLLASLIALVMTGGRLELRPGDGVLPQGSNTYRVLATNKSPQFDFESQLYFDWLGKGWNLSDSQKTGPLLGGQRDELSVEIHNRRRPGARAEAMCFIIDGDVSSVVGLDVVHTLKVPVFHANADTSEIIFGLDEAKIVSHLKLLWDDVCAYHAPDSTDGNAA